MQQGRGQDKQQEEQQGGSVAGCSCQCAEQLQPAMEVPVRVCRAVAVPLLVHAHLPRPACCVPMPQRLPVREEHQRARGQASA